jgi:glyoxylase-like metal-dependent hydrolase (beta-lactamase superfamily II)
MSPPESLPVSRNWYRIEAVGEALTLITEPRVRGLLRANAWLVRGRDRDILVDCGLGVASLWPTVASLTQREPVVVLTHAHLDHMGAAHEFAECWAHPLEHADHPPPGSLLGPHLAAELGLAEALPDVLITAVPHESYDLSRYRLRPVNVTRHLNDGDVIDLGQRAFTVMHLPGHSPGSIGLFDEHDGTLISGDTIYDDVLIDEITGADIADYVASLQRLRELPVRVVLPGHFPRFDGTRMRQLIDMYLTERGRRSDTPPKKGPTTSAVRDRPCWRGGHS